MLPLMSFPFEIAYLKRIFMASFFFEAPFTSAFVIFAFKIDMNSLAIYISVASSV